jgi:hypothetical protein
MMEAIFSLTNYATLPLVADHESSIVTVLVGKKEKRKQKSPFRQMGYLLFLCNGDDESTT